ncbi:DUF6923 family protein [Streptomyces sp. NPDC098077]|uniref:DUF6923 family protein n=1 Tax=Streptomyces sp. NPDC098077 TaxID=3366093 RepID=UPI00382E4DA8
MLRKTWFLATGLAVAAAASSLPALAQAQPSSPGTVKQPHGAARALAPFACAGDILLAAGDDATQLFQGVTGPGTIDFQAVGAATAKYNAMGVNPDDKYIYALDRTTFNLLRVDDAGAVTDLGSVGLPTPTTGANNYASGGFDDAGNYYVANGYNDRMYRVDLDTKQSTEIVLSQTLDGVIDFAYSEGFLWGAAQDGSVVRITPGTGAVSVYPGIVPATTGYGGAFTYGNGDLGFFSNTGSVLRVAVTNPGSPAFELLSTQDAPAMSAAVDATSCFERPVDLGVVKTGPATVSPGGVIAYTITITNNGPNASSGWTLSDPVPAGLADAATTTDGCTVTSGSLSCTGGALAVGETVGIELTGRAADGVSEVVNTATVSGNDPDPNPDNDTDTATTKVTASVDLGVVKSGPATVQAGGKIEYTITVTNKGPSSSSGWTLTDTIPAQIQNPSTATAGCTVAAGKLTCTGGPLAAGDSRTLKVSGTVAPKTTGKITNTAVVTGNEPDPKPDNNQDTTTTDVKGTPGLSIVKKQNGPKTVKPGAEVSYTITVKNTGTTAYTSARPASFTDNLTDLLDDARYNTDATATRGTVSYKKPTLSWSGALTPGQSATITFSVTTDARPFGDTKLRNTVVSKTPGNNCPSGSKDTRCTTLGKVDVRDKDK